MYTLSLSNGIDLPFLYFCSSVRRDIAVLSIAQYSHCSDAVIVVSAIIKPTSIVKLVRVLSRSQESQIDYSNL
jgi:hypothetical protein